MLPESAKELIRSGAYAHLATIDRDGSPHVTLAWAGLDGDDILIATLGDQRKLRNIRRDPRVTLSFQGTKLNEWGLREYLIVRGTAEISEGGAPALLQELARTYLGPDAKFPPMDEPPPGYVTRITAQHVGGPGPWSGGD